MMNDEQTDRAMVSQRHFRDGEVFGRFTISALNPQRRHVLETRRNMWVSDKPKEQTEELALAEWLFVLSRTKEQLTQAITTPHAAWDEEVERFLMDLTDEELNGFAARVADEFAAFASVVVEEAEEGKTEGPGEEKTLPGPDASQNSEPQACLADSL